MLSRLTTSLASPRRQAAALCETLAEAECRLAAAMPALATGESWLLTLTMRAVQMVAIAFH